MHGKGMGPHDALDWTNECEWAFTDLKQAICEAPGVPNYKRPFQLCADERGGFMTAVLGQDHGGPI